MKKQFLILSIMTILVSCKPVDITTLREMDFVKYQLDHQSQEKPQVKAKVTWDSNSNIIIELDASVEDRASFQASFEGLHNATTAYIRSCSPRFKNLKAVPFIVKAKNMTITIP